MKYPTMRYVEAGPRHLALHSFDGTCRGVVFATDEAAARARLPGRADIDVTAIENGFLPREATLVSRAGRGDVDAILAETRTDGSAPDPLAAVRLKFSLDLLISRSEWIDEERDAIARERDPVAAKRYEGIVDELEASQRRG